MSEKPIPFPMLGDVSADEATALFAAIAKVMEATAELHKAGVLSVDEVRKVLGLGPVFVQ